MGDWKVNYGIKPAALCVDVRFAGHDGLTEECLNEHPDEWVWSLDQEEGTITMYRIVEPLPKDNEVLQEIAVTA